MPPTDDNNKVTLARLGEKVDNLTNEVMRMRATVDRRMTNLEELLHVETSDLRARCQDNATNIARLDERQKSTTSILTGMSIVFSSIAATIGALFK